MISLKQITWNKIEKNLRRKGRRDKGNAHQNTFCCCG
jgi:hypothetical protein